MAIWCFLGADRDGVLDLATGLTATVIAALLMAYPIVLLRLSKAAQGDVEPLLRRQWRTLASRKAVAAFDRD
jgi:hypothetical protein